MAYNVLSGDLGVRHKVSFLSIGMILRMIQVETPSGYIAYSILLTWIYFQELPRHMIELSINEDSVLSIDRRYR